MARLEDFLNEARGEALALLEDAATRPDRSAVGVTPVPGKATPPYEEEMLRGRFENEVRAGVRPVMRGAYAAMSAAGADADAPHMQSLSVASRMGLRDDGREEGVPVNARMARIGTCLATVGDLVGADMSAGELRRVRDHVASTTAHVARVVAGTQTRSRDEALRERLPELAEHLDRSRSTRPPHDLGETGLKGVPGEAPLEQNLHRWRVLAHEALDPHRIAESPRTARLVAMEAAAVSAAAHRACLAQGSPAARERAERWTVQAGAWADASRSWQPPPLIAGGRMQPDPEVLAASRALRETVVGEFRTHDQRWVPVDRLADPEGLRRFEHDARAAMTELAARYNAAVTQVSRSELLTLPASQMTRTTDGPGLDPTKLFQKWTTLPVGDPAAQRLRDGAAAVEVASLRLDRPGPAMPSMGSQAAGHRHGVPAANREVGPRANFPKGHERN